MHCGPARSSVFPYTCKIGEHAETVWYGGPNNLKKANPALEFLSLTRRTEQFLIAPRLAPSR
jgi:hypothetical protein